MYYLYILLCNKAFFYVGITNDVDKRLKQHIKKQSSHTKRYKEVELVYKEEYKTIFEAELREKQIKGWSREKKKALVEGNISELIQLSKS
jgi:putative endonuclease